MSENKTYYERPTAGISKESKTPKKKKWWIAVVLVLGMIITVTIGKASASETKAQEDTIKTENGSTEKGSSGWEHKSVIENWVKETFVPEADFDNMANYAAWEADGFWVAQNEFKLPNDEQKHTYSARYGIIDKTITVFYLAIDDEEVFSDVDAQWEYLEQIEESKQ